MDLTADACFRALRTRDARFDGRFFVGVKTTGIYCRPVCPARTPKRANVAFYPSAAAAQSAGFRPCLRCRPETAPELNAWRGTSNTVSRALPLIEMGALDEGDVDALAARLGVGDRQLRRLFHTHLGASPIEVAQARRIHLAKQLLHDTTLPMADVALAAGFGSIRRFNEAFQNLFGQAPTMIRARRERDGQSPRGEDITVLLRYQPPYDWPAILSFLEHRAIPGVEAVTGGTYSRTIEIGRQHGTVSVGFSDGHTLRATIRFPRLSALPGIIARLRRVFDLAADPIAIGAQLSEDPALAPLVAARPGLRVPGAWDGFELAIRAVLGQQITVTAAGKLAGQLVALCGDPVPRRLASVDKLTHVFPSPARLAGTDLSPLRMPGQRKAALMGLAEAVLKQPDILGPGPGLEDAVAQLRALPGIGEWTAQYIAMRQLREPDAFPFGDIGLLRAMADQDGRRPTPRELLARAERWRPWRAYAALHLWASLTAAGDASRRGGTTAAV